MTQPEEGAADNSLPPLDAEVGSAPKPAVTAPAYGPSQPEPAQPPRAAPAQVGAAGMVGAWPHMGLGL